MCVCVFVCAYMCLHTCAHGWGKGQREGIFMQTPDSEQGARLGAGSPLPEIMT